MNILYADFNERDRAGRVLVRGEGLPPGTNLGTRVIVRDHEGNEAEGRVVVIDIRDHEFRLVRVRVDFSTWRDAPLDATRAPR